MAGTITFTANTLIGPDPGVSGDGVLARLEFRALAASPAGPVSLHNLLLLDSGLGVIDAAPVPGSVTITAVPEPASVVFLSAGLAALMLRARRRKKR